MKLIKTDIWSLKDELIDLCLKCTTLKPSTAKSYAKKLFNKYSVDDGCINHYSYNEHMQRYNIENDLKRAINILKKGWIVSDQGSLNIKDVSYVEFKDEIIIIRTNYGKEYSYMLDNFRCLEYVFKNN